ncbi:hypothetical protein B566_EDAN000985 [Ephemera danica]|nr:hypothetical protein B566_EDAN000985 [Ephemera danica]
MSTSTVQAKSTDGEATPPGTLSVSRSPSISSLMARRTPVDDNSTFKMELRPRVRSFGERDSSITSMGDCTPRADDYVILKVHGISEAGPAIKVELVQVLQNRLADAVLELLCVMLSRNPMCKLTPEDVHFIQKPYVSAHTCLEYCIQSHALSNLQAMVFYLKQNLLQFLHTPKYTDNRPENHFQDYSRSNMSKDRVFEEDIFLYNQSATCGSRGMACIALAVVDSNGQLLQYNSYSKSSVETYQNHIFFDTDFDTLTATKVCTEDIEKPPTHIEFRIWKQGRVNMEFLSKKLLSAIQHATWDLLMEFKLLTAPLSHQLKAQTVHTTTGLASPLIPNVEAIPDDLCTSVVPKSCTQPEELSLALDSEMVATTLESGESGQLHQVYHQIMCKWLNYAIDIGVPAVKKHSVIFKARQSLAVCLKELQRLITVNASDTSVAVFKLIPNDEQDIFVPYQTIPSFTNDSRWDDANASTTCLLIGRNLKQWKACVTERPEYDPDILYPKAQKVFQKFPPLLICGPDKSSPTSGKCSNPPCIQFVPRQRLLIATLSDKEVTIFTYNWSKDRSENLNKQVSNLGHWLVGRSSLITSIITQKLGLFNNQAFNRQTGDLRKNFIDQSHLTVKEVEQLVKLPATAQKEFLAVGRRSNTAPTVCIQDAFRDVKPSHAALCSSTDSVLCNGQQLLELCIVDKKEHQKKLYQLWQTRVATPNIPVTEDVLHLLQQNSRVIHFCLTPLLFLPSWRIQAAATRDHTLAPTTSNIKQDLRLLLASRSRNESGNSMKSMEGSRSTKSGASPQTSPKARRIQEDKWHQKLCTHFIQEYKQYLHTLGFVPIQTELNSPKKGVPKLSTGSGTGSNSKEDRQRKLSGPAALGISSSQVRRPKEENTHFMQKSLLGGILIFEVLLNEPFFQAKLHALECSRLQSKTSSGLISQFTFSFLDECDKIKILMHLHSFTYDYHLRTIHNFVSSQQTNLKIGFHLKNFIDDFIKYYSKSPNYARNLVYSDSVCVTNTSTPAGQLYSFLWTHEDLYQMEVFSMCPETECCMDNEYVLVQLKNTHPVTYKDNHDMKQTDDFDVTLIVAHENIDGSGSNTLHLKYFIILTSRREHYPKHVIERKLGKFCTVPLATPQLTTSVATLPNISESEGPTEEVAEESSNGHEQLNFTDVIPHHIEIRQEAVNYMGYYSSHEQLMQQLILQQASAVEQQVITMVEQGMVHCRTHILWETLVSCILAEDKSKRRELSFEEFCELLKLASVESLSMLDHRLAPLLCQSLSWYQNLDRVLSVKYGNEVVKRFISPDCSVQYTVVLSTGYLEAFTMLSIDVHTSRGELSIVCKKTPQNPDTNFNAVNNLKLLSPSLQSLIEGFVNACCYHLWASLV